MTKILPYTSQASFGGKPADILGSAFVTVTNPTTAEDMQKSVIAPLSEQALTKGGNVLLCVRESNLGNGQSIFTAGIGRLQP